MSLNIDEIWEKSLSLIEKKTGSNTVDLWFRPIRLLSIKDRQAIIGIPNRFFRDWIEDNYPEIINEVLKDILGFPVILKYKISERIDPDIKRMDIRLESRRQRLANKGIYLNPKYTFENFITGPSNQFAQAAAKVVANTPGKVYNPLFIYGGVGLGKTHLINAIGNSVIDKMADMSVIYVTAEQFTNEVVSAIRHEKMGELKEKYRNVDLLLLDDIHFIANKTQTQEEFFHTFNTIYGRQKQIVISSDRPPKELGAITDRLRSRFMMGLIADIQPPELETKVAIIQKKADIEKIDIPEDVAYYLASKVKSNIRELEGCLIRLGAQSSLTNRPIDLEMAKTVLKDIIDEDDKPLTPETILKLVADCFDVRVNDIKSKRRTKEVALPRQVAMYLIKKLTELSLSDIGKHLGGKDHATVIYACKQVEEKMSQDEKFKKIIDGILKKINT